MSKSIPEIQQIPARHGTATFVPKGQVIKIINTYGKQVVDTWAFALPKPPSQQEVDEQNETEEEAQQATEQESRRSQVPKEGDHPQHHNDEDEATAAENADGPQSGPQETAEREDGAGTPTPGPKQRADNEENEARKDNPNSAQKVAGSETETDTDKSAKEDNMKGSWSSYLPSLSRSRGKAPQTGDPKGDGTATSDAAGKQPKTWAQYLSSSSGSTSKAKDGNERTWASYFPSGKSFSNYVPKNVSMSAFTSSHLRDPTKSYAEQLYDFSKTPVGAGALSAATGSGYAGTAYAAYQAYVKSQEAAATNPPMEYLSMSATHSSTNHLIPKVDDVLVSNLRQPMLTVVEDTSAVHDTVIAACDPQRYRELGVEEWEQHGSCAENLVLALKEINASAGLKGPKAVGADVTVNTVPQPLNLFMNIPFDGDGQLSFEAPKGKKGEYIRMRAERDLVVVMSACPQDQLPINGHKCMAAHFVVQEQEESQKPTSRRPAISKQASAGASRNNTGAAKAAPKQQQPPKQPVQPKAKEPGVSKPSTPTVKRPSQPSIAKSGPTPSVTPQRQSTSSETPSRKPQPAPKAGKGKPKKLERRMTPQTGTAQT